MPCGPAACPGPAPGPAQAGRARRHRHKGPNAALTSPRQPPRPAGATNPRPRARSTPAFRGRSRTKPREPRRHPRPEATRGAWRPACPAPGPAAAARRGCARQRPTHGGLVAVHLGVLEGLHGGLRRRGPGSRGGGGERAGGGEARRRPRGWGRVLGRGGSSRQQARSAAQAERRRRHTAAPCQRSAGAAAQRPLQAPAVMAPAEGPALPPLEPAARPGHRAPGVPGTARVPASL